MDISPSTFIQIHYHYRHGGVRNVIDRYSKMFHSYSDSNSQSYLICSKREALQAPVHPLVVDCPNIDYTEFHSLDHFLKIRNDLIHVFCSLFESSRNKKPIVVFFHNSSLGKNLAASSAFAHCARIYGSSEIRFFAVLHDFAEECRDTMLSAIDRCDTWGISILKDLYLVGAPVQFIVPGYLAFEILASLRFPVTLLPNSVTATPNTISKKDILERLYFCARNDGLSLNLTLPFYYYPSRIIRRKNIYEALVISLMYSVNLIMGAKGQSSADCVRFDRIISIAKEYQLNVVVDTGRCDILSGDEQSPVPALYALCDVVLSTSVAEGFGYALYEPFLYNRPLIARCPSGFRYHCNIPEKVLYSSFPVFGEWVNKDVVIRLYQQRFGYNKWVEKKVQSIKDATILDFADLDDMTQEEILRKALDNRNKLERWKQLVEIPDSGWPGLSALQKNASVNLFQYKKNILQYFLPEKDCERFKTIINKIPIHNNEEYFYYNLKNEFFNRGLSLHT